ncbi:hypothetical protein J2Z48_000195 [Croceifilum oryzae]|uniref:Preprotein translocase subunit SecB n=1 Tax=Croceifilum oryzae TaxID=1553429 RepID=A0AAJ1WNZ8_9BACL|nr:hypothetical protein [Croceifilum oryzae]MDQ0416037.1 hypothetical protein [Croceifilum oryzae]
MSQTNQFDWLERWDLEQVSVRTLHCTKWKEYELDIEKHILLNYSTKLLRQTGVDISFLFSLSVLTYEGEKKEDPAEILDEDRTFTIELEIDIVYYKELAETIPEAELMEIGSQIVAPDAWAYARELLSNMTVRMGYRPLLLPPYQKVVYGG